MSKPYIYQKKCESESEDEMIVYNHNNVLSSMTFNEYC